VPEFVESGSAHNVPMMRALLMQPVSAHVKVLDKFKLSRRLLVGLASYRLGKLVEMSGQRPRYITTDQ
jgi:hypothetical protein